jgi:hypothetical protein
MSKMNVPRRFDHSRNVWPHKALRPVGPAARGGKWRKVNVRACQLEFGGHGCLGPLARKQSPGGSLPARPLLRLGGQAMLARTQEIQEECT